MNAYASITITWVIITCSISYWSNFFSLIVLPRNVKFLLSLSLCSWDSSWSEELASFSSKYPLWYCKWANSGLSAKIVVCCILRYATLCLILWLWNTILFFMTYLRPDYYSFLLDMSWSLVTLKPLFLIGSIGIIQNPKFISHYTFMLGLLAKFFFITK